MYKNLGKIKSVLQEYRVSKIELYFVKIYNKLEIF